MNQNRSSLSVEWKDDPAMDADEFYQNRADDLTASLLSREKPVFICRERYAGDARG